MNHYLTVYLLSILPLGELRVTLPLGIKSYGLGVWETIILAVAGVMTAVLIIFLLADPVVGLLRKVSIFDRAIDWLFKRTRDKHGHKMKTWGGITLTIIAISPLPVLGGGWSATLVAYLFDVSRVKAFGLIAIGTFISSLIVLALTEGISIFI